MPSSSWRLIHETQGSTPVEDPAGAGKPSDVAVDATRANVFHGRSRSSTHQTSGNSGTPMVASGLAAGVDPVVLGEEIRRVEHAAEERGYEIGHNRAESELRAAVEGAGALANRLQTIAPERTSEIAHAIAELALAVAKRIIQHEVRLEPSLPFRWPSEWCSTKSR